ncbi:enoyl-CoA hydratase family protein [Streptomyces pinistramenti]|uniref:enoyl-CoA hydratase family protein n=1 Tax=Streptomyces pinistramenti TaxID=2884812 RepID=UPI001D08C5AD|nr:enoyl-CoA hydratase family protein [Streptomyces pinistramenti]MCB5906006.1 enoyl-CoA hydratase family protein [Streptomyces pinistramenti]
MGVSTSRPGAPPGGRGIALVTVDFPPVNALPVQGWYDLADAVRDAGRDPGIRCVVLAAAGRGFNAGVDIKEMQRTEGHAALIGANRGCYEAFAAVYDCEVPVVAAVAGYCLGGGIGLVGNADAIVASDDATFGLPELDRGALGAATHLARLVPPHLMRTLYYTSRTVTSQELRRHGSVWDVVPRAQVRDAALALAGEIAAKDGSLIRLAKAAINGIDPVDVRRSYRFEQGFTFEANLSGIADRHRDAFMGRRGDPGPVGADPGPGPHAGTKAPENTAPTETRPPPVPPAVPPSTPPKEPR